MFQCFYCGSLPGAQNTLHGEGGAYFKRLLVIPIEKVLSSKSRNYPNNQLIVAFYYFLTQFLTCGSDTAVCLNTSDFRNVAIETLCRQSWAFIFPSHKFHLS